MNVTPQAPIAWWKALNPPIYLISILPGIGVWLLARPPSDAGLSLGAATVAVVLLQHAVNLLNDAADWRLGADGEKRDSWVRVHGGDLAAVIRHGGVSFLAGATLGLWTLVRADRLWILVIALPLVALGYRYNSGEKPWSYTHLGEWVTGLCYGPGVFGCLWLLVWPGYEPPAVLGCIAFACLAVAVLLSHQPPQILSDRQAGKRSFAVRYGPVRTYRAVRMLFAFFLVSWGWALGTQPVSALTLIIYLGLACLALACTMTLVKEPSPKTLLLLTTGLFVGQLFTIPVSA